MVDLIELVNAFVSTLQRIPEVVEDLGGSPASIIGYIDIASVRNSMNNAVYSQKSGTVLVLWREMVMTEGEMAWYEHHVELQLRARPGSSILTLIKDIVDGVPDPGDGMCWLRCQLLPGLDPTQVARAYFETDEEGIDHGVIETTTKEIAPPPE